MNATLKAQIEAKAREAAAGFVEEFGEPINPSKTDWDGEAWFNDRLDLGIDDDDDVEAGWPIYQTALVAETRNLCRKSAV
jgi:hypothetical protein